MNQITVSGLRKRFGQVQALDGVSLEVEPGEVVALLGPNGAGKSTLIRILGTTVLADEGTAMVAGIDVAADTRAARRACGLMLGDERSWYWRISGRQNLEFFCTLHDLDRGTARRRTDELLEQFGLAEAADRPFRGYSAGMRARLSLARSLVAEPRALLLDEPARNLDPVASAEFRATIEKLAVERDSAILFATHDLHEAAEVANRIVGLTAGRVVFTHPRGTEPAQLEAALVAAA